MKHFPLFYWVKLSILLSHQDVGIRCFVGSKVLLPLLVGYEEAFKEMVLGAWLFTLDNFILALGWAIRSVPAMIASNTQYATTLSCYC